LQVARGVQRWIERQLDQVLQVPEGAVVWKEDEMAARGMDVRSGVVFVGNVRNWRAAVRLQDVVLEVFNEVRLRVE
jgi:hypothetical protein